MSLLQPFFIGNVRISHPVALGPMAGVTDLPFRMLCREAGAGLVCTEMVSAKAILYRNKNTAALMRIGEGEHPCALQLFGNDPETVAEAAAMIEELPFDILDLNMGCPVPKVVNNNEGSALMKDPALAGRIVEAVVKRIRKPVTVKIRKGFDNASCNAAEVARILEASGAAAIAVHGRTREQYYSGKADWECIRQVKEAVKIPVFGNGDVNSAASARRMLEETGADGVMAARGARGNPWLFTELRAALCGDMEWDGRPDGPEIYAMILRHLDLIIREKGEYTGVREMRKHIAWYTTGLKGSASLRRRINEAEDPEEIKKMLAEVLLV